MLTNRGNSRRLEINQAIQNILTGQPYALPNKSIAIEMREIILKSGVGAALSTYQTVKVDASDYDLSEGEINGLGYRLLYGDHRPQDALQIFALNTAEHPSSSNALDSLAEAYQVIGDKAAAKKYYGLALEKDSTNLHAKAMLERLK
jgi:tetratricopeptide (TPR) repeat protein